MASSFDRQEIINTPEAKGMRCAPSERGRSVSVARLLARRQVGLKQTRVINTGRQEPPGAYLRRKEEAAALTDQVYDCQMMQEDRHRFSVPEGDGSKLTIQSKFAGLDDTEYAPPDAQIASGPEHLLVAVNASWAIFDKTGRQLLRRNFSDLFGGVVEQPLIFRPRVIYDQFRGGWLLAACGISADGRQSWFLLAASQGADPLGDWWVWTLDASADGSQRTGLRPDNMHLAVDANNIYLTAAMFTAQGQFAYSKLRMLGKKDLIHGGILQGWDFWQLRNADGSTAFGVQPALNLKSPDAQYFLNITNDGQGITQWRISQSPRQAPALSRKLIPTAPWQMAPDARQQSVEQEIDTGDGRLCQAVYSHGLLWTARTVGANWSEPRNRSAIQWFQVNPKAGVVTQQGIFGARGYDYFCPTVIVDNDGTLVLVFNRVGDNDPPSICFSGRFADDEPNRLLESVELLQSSTAGAAQWSCSGGAGTAPDEAELWVIGQYMATKEDWATWISSLKPLKQARSPESQL